MAIAKITITTQVPVSLGRRIEREAKAARQSKSAWMLTAAEEKLAALAAKREG